MKKLLFAAATTLVSFISVHAQQPSDSTNHFRRQMHHRINDLSKQLDFTDAQKQQFKSINQELHIKMMELNKNENITVREWKQKKADILKEHSVAIQNLLTPRQKTKMKELREMASARFHKMSQKRLEKMQTNLNLSDDQVSKIKGLSEDLKSQMKTIHENNALSTEDKRAQATALFRQHKEDFKSVLTQEQLGKLEQLTKERVAR